MLSSSLIKGKLILLSKPTKIYRQRIPMVIYLLIVALVNVHKIVTTNALITVTTKRVRSTQHII